MRFNLFRALRRERGFARWKLSASIALPLIAVMAISPSAAATSANATGQGIRQAKPITSIGRVQPSVVPSVFGTVAVPFGTTPMSARWTRVLSASVNDPTLARLTSAARDLSSYQKAAFVQSVVHRGVRNHSGARCSDDGYWAVARESLARGSGDCVDIAIAKMEALRQLGVPIRDLYLITGRRLSTTGLEAALLVRTREQFYLLSARADPIVEAGQDGSFTPIVTYGVGMTWAHGVPIGSRRTLTKPQTASGATHLLLPDAGNHVNGPTR